MAGHWDPWSQYLALAARTRPRVHRGPTLACHQILLLRQLDSSFGLVACAWELELMHWLCPYADSHRMHLHQHATPGPGPGPDPDPGLEEVRPPG